MMINIKVTDFHEGALSWFLLPKWELPRAWPVGR